MTINSNDYEIFKKEESVEILKIRALINSTNNNVSD